MGEYPPPTDRLGHSSEQVRRVAILDLAKQPGEASLAALLAHLPGERDERAAILIVRCLGQAAYAPAHPVLAAIRDSLDTPVRLYHAALLAHDRIERSQQGGPTTATPARP